MTYKKTLQYFVLSLFIGTYSAHAMDLSETIPISEITARTIEKQWNNTNLSGKKAILKKVYEGNIDCRPWILEKVFYGFIRPESYKILGLDIIKLLNIDNTSDIDQLDNVEAYILAKFSPDNSELRRSIFSLIDKRATPKNSKALNILGLMFEENIGVDKKFTESSRYLEAFKNYQAAADLGFAPAYYNLGWLYKERKVTNLLHLLNSMWNIQKSYTCFRKAARMYFAPAQNQLGWMHQRGESVPKNDTKATKYYKMAIDQHYCSAQVQMGIINYLLETEESYKEAFKYFSMAEEHGLASSFQNLATLYAEGKGVIKNSEKAIYYYQLAIDNGSTKAQESLNEFLSTTN